MQELRRTSLADAAAERLRDEILTGVLSPGERLNEVRLAKALGVSRTPLREALIGLQSEGFAEREPGRGFRVRRLTSNEVAEIYPIRAALEVLALQSAGPPPESALAELRSTNWEVAQVSQPSGRVEHDEAFHRALLAHCPNGRLLDLVAELTARCRLYEYRILTAGVLPRDSAQQHTEILEALKAGDVAAACQRLHDHLVGGLEQIVSWFESSG
jgi:DNA-binding GntR family transcriptional regulator